MAMALSGSTVKSWFQYRCPRKTRYETLSPKERDAIPIVRDVVSPAWAQLGNRFERQVLDRLSTEAAVLRPFVGEEYLSQAQSVSFIQGERSEEFAAQLLLEARAPLREHLSLSEDVVIRRSYADLVRVDRSTGTPIYQVIDIKAAQRATPFHKAQVAFYGLLLRATLSALHAPGRLAETGQIWCLPKNGDEDRADHRVEEFRMEPYERLVVDFFHNEVPVIAKSTVTPRWDNTFFHIYFKCEQCEYLRHCREAISIDVEPGRRDLSAVPGVSHEAKRTLNRLGVKTVGQLADAQGIRASSGGSWILRRRAEMLNRRAQALIANQVQRIPGLASYLMPPRVDVGLYLVVDVDPTEDNLVTLGYLRRECEDRRYAVEILSGGSLEDESAAICRILGRLIDDLAEIDRVNAASEDSPAQQIQAHVFVYEPSEARGLKEAVGRHLENPLVRTGLLHMVRMFPPEDVVPEPEFRGIHHLPATAVRSVVEQLYALPVMVSYDQRQVTQVLAEEGVGFLQSPYLPSMPFERAFSSRLSIDVVRALREGRIDQEPMHQDVISRLDSLCSLTDWLVAENEMAENRTGGHAFLRLKKRPFRFQETLNPLDAVDLELLNAFELLENRAGMLEALVSLAQPFGQRRDRARCMANLRLERHWRTDWGQYGMLFTVPHDSRESELSSANRDLILSNDDPDIRLNPTLWPLFEVNMARERQEFAGSGSLLLNVSADVFEGTEFQRLIRETPADGWFLDRTFKDFTTHRATNFISFLAGEER